jgi:hypothetical protein
MASIPTNEVTVRVETDAEAYPTLIINEVGHADQGYVIPAALMDALAAAEAAVDKAEEAIMRHIAQQNPDAGDIAYWVRARDNQPRWQAAVDAYAADHPDGPSWDSDRCSAATRLRYLDAAGYQP